MLLGSTVKKGTDGNPGPVAIVSSVVLSGCKVGSANTAAAFQASQRLKDAAAAKTNGADSSSPPPPPPESDPPPAPSGSPRPTKVVVLDSAAVVLRFSLSLLACALALRLAV